MMLSASFFVGIFLLLCWSAYLYKWYFHLQVVSTCSTDAVGLLSELGCSFAVDYKDNEHMSYISQQAPYV